MSRNESPPAKPKLYAWKADTAALLDPIELWGKDAIVVHAEMNAQGDTATVVAWGLLKGEVPTTYPYDPDNIPEGEIWTLLSDPTVLTAAVDTANPPDAALLGGAGKRAKVVEFDCQGYSQVRLELTAVDDEVTLWVGAKRRLY